jgi:phthalate 4,5-dioxygenase oxygenase subunit
MLTKDDNELLTRVGPGTPMGDLLRQYWIPTLISSELPAPDCPPIRIRLLCENLIAFRTTSGKVGVVANACPHRGASLFFGRNEEEGLRCVYHGWKFDVAGNCVDMPSEPVEGNFKSKVKATCYPTEERGGLVWTYMGPRTSPPLLPMLEPNMLPEKEACGIYPYFSDCNWLQSLEGDLDTIHFPFLHAGSTKLADLTPGSLDYYSHAIKWANFLIEDAPFGATYGCYRPAEADTTYWRIAQYLFPFYAMVPSGYLGEKIWFKAVVPVDDEHCMRWDVGSERQQRSRGGAARDESGPRNPPGTFLPTRSDWLGRFYPTQNRDNDYLIDREVQKANFGPKGYTGIPRPGQDPAVTESMGKVSDRSREHLGVTDSMVIRLRRLLLKAATALRDQGTVPPGVDNPEVYAVRSGAIVLRNGVDGIEATRDLQRAFMGRENEESLAPTIYPIALGDSHLASGSHVGKSDDVWVGHSASA